ncbi:MAG: hypothetical protein ACRC7S_10110 [Cetobacterium sp.]
MSEPIKHVDAFGTEVSIGDTIAFCNTKYQGYTRMDKAEVVGFTATNFRISIVRFDKPVVTSIMKVKAVKL